jgi:competence protein ComEC
MTSRGEVPGRDYSSAAPARPLVPLAAAFCLGITLGDLFLFPPVAWAVIVALCLGLAGGAWWAGARRLFPLLLIAAFGCLGGQAMALARAGAPLHHVSRLTPSHLDSPIALEGWVVTPPDPRPADVRDAGTTERTRFVVEVARLRLGQTWASAAGRARLTVLGEVPAPRYGDEIRGVFRLRHPRGFGNPGAFDYPRYLATQGVFLEGWTREPVEVIPAARGSRILAAVFRLRAMILERLDGVLPSAEAGLLKATVLGDRSGLTPEMNQAFLDSGTYHILAISGLNVSILAGTLFGLFRLLRASPPLAAAAAMLLVTFYAALAGASASVVRAAVMADTYLLAVILDRRGDLLNTLALSALVLLWWNPHYLFDVGFQLTYLATLGIILVLPRCEEKLARWPRPLRYILASMAITLAATLMTLPVLAATFNRISPVGLLANIPIVPLSGLITGLGTLLCSLLLVEPSGLLWLNHLNGWLVDLLFASARWFAAVPWGSLRVYTPTAGMLLAYYGLVGGWLLLTRSPQGEPASPRARRIGRGLLIVCTLALVIQVGLRLHPPEGGPKIRLSMLDVGQGEAIFLELPGRRRLLIDAGGVMGEGFDVGARVVAPFLWHEWVGNLDALVLTHPESDHVGGAPAILREFQVREVWVGEQATYPVTALWLQEYLRHQRIPCRVVSAESSPIRVGVTAVEILHPSAGIREGQVPAGERRSRSNADSVVLRVGIGGRWALFTGDIGAEEEAALVAGGAPLRAQVLKVPHHGSRTSSTPAFLAAVQPEIGLVSVGYRNPFRHPHPDIVERYVGAGIRFFRTDRHGAIRVEMSAERIRTSASRDE